jgi:hypothetical protein
METEIMELGSLDINIYKCITPHIDTNRVIITDSQLDHIANHHPESYDESLIELKNTLSFPAGKSAKSAWIIIYDTNLVY